MEKGNFLEGYARYASELTDAPEHFHRFIGYSVISTIVERRVWMPYGKFPLYPNLWMVLMGRSGGIRKTTSMNMGRHFIYKFKQKLVMPDEFTQEGIFKTFGAQAQGTLYFSEFGAFLGMLEKDYNAGCKHFLTELYDCPDSRTKQLSGGPLLIKDMYLGIVGCTTLEWFTEKLKANDIAGGFLARFLLIPGGKKTKVLTMPPEDDPVKDQALSTELARLDAFIIRVLLDPKRGKDRGKLALSPQARVCYDAFYHSMDSEIQGKDPQVVAFFERLLPYSLKLSILNAINELSPTIEEGHFRKAMKDVLWVYSHLNELTENFTYSPQDQLRLKVQTFIKAAYPESVNRSTLLNNIRNLNARSLEAITETLEQADRISVAFDTSTSHTKKSLLYKWIQPVK